MINRDYQTHGRKAGKKKKGEQKMPETRTETMLMVIAVASVLVLLGLGGEILAPVLSALVAGIVLSPLVRLGDRLGLRPAASAFAAMLLAICLFLLLAVLLEPYVAQAIESAPSIWAELRSSIYTFRDMLLGLEEIAEDVADAVDPSNNEDGSSESPVTIPRATDALLYAPLVVAQFFTFLGTLYFFLMTRLDIYAWLGRMIDSLKPEDFIAAEKQVARYFLTITAINLCLGILVAIVMRTYGFQRRFFGV